MSHILSQTLSGQFTGDLVQSGYEAVELGSVLVEQLNDLLVKVSFDLNGEKIVFRAMLRERQGNILMTVQQRVTRGYILDGKSGFLYGVVNTHGGMLKALGSMYFHVKMAYFDGRSQEVYFLGKQSYSTGSIKKNSERIEIPV